MLLIIIIYVLNNNKETSEKYIDISLTISKIYIVYIDYYSLNRIRT